MNVYIRDRGPICFEAKVFFDPALLVQLQGELLSSGLDWCWESIRRDTDEIIPESNLPPARPMTSLAAANIEEFLSDLRERDADGYGRWVALFGVDPCTVGALLDGPTSPSFRMAFERFTSSEAGPIRIVVVQVSDHNYEYVFVPQHPVDAVSNLLKEWGITFANRKSRPYKALRLAQLETIYEVHGPRRR